MLDLFKVRNLTTIVYVVSLRFTLIVERKYFVILFIPEEAWCIFLKCINVFAIQVELISLISWTFLAIKLYKLWHDLHYLKSHTQWYKKASVYGIIVHDLHILGWTVSDSIKTKTFSFLNIQYLKIMNKEFLKRGIQQRY